MTSIADTSVKIQTTSESNPSPPCWFGEVVMMSRYLRTQGILSKITEQVCFARKRFGRYEFIDFLAVLFGYAISGERTLEEFYERLQPFAVPFMALFERDRLHTWLAWQKQPGKSMGQAITSRYVEYNALHARNLIAWFCSIFELPYKEDQSISTSELNN